MSGVENTKTVVMSSKHEQYVRSKERTLIPLYAVEESMKMIVIISIMNPNELKHGKNF